jgi:bifunctional non-homologous end joining protein LigD
MGAQPLATQVIISPDMPREPKHHYLSSVRTPGDAPQVPGLVRRHPTWWGGAMARAEETETREGVVFSSLDGPLFDGADATKRDLVDYLDAVADRMLPGLRDRPLSVVRVRPGQEPFMQKNLPRYAPDWIRSTSVWAQASQRDVRYALCDDRRTLLWFANQRAVEYHPTLMTMEQRHPSHLVLDLDPPAGDDFAHVVAAAALVRRALADSGLAGAVKTSGAKGLHVLVPLVDGLGFDDVAAATRALAARAERVDPAVATTAYIREDREGKVFLDSTRSGGATIAAAYSPRVRPGAPVSFPVDWDDLADVTPADFTIRTAPDLLGDTDPWRDRMPEPQPLPADLVAEGHTIPVARVTAMHEGKRRARARRKDPAPGP